MKNRTLAIGAAAGLMLAALAAGHEAYTQEGAPAPTPQPPPQPQERSIPGINAPDPFINGCVSCHVNKPEGDGRLSTAMKQWAKGASPKLLAKAKAAAPKGMTLTGKHPPIPVNLVPGGCLSCHGKNSKIGPPMAQMIHLIHLTGEENNFIKKHGGECTHCHKLNLTTGLWILPNKPEAPSE
jgi:hypothetical protein